MCLRASARSRCIAARRRSPAAIPVGPLVPVPGRGAGRYRDAARAGRDESLRGPWFRTRFCIVSKPAIVKDGSSHLFSLPRRCMSGWSIPARPASSRGRRLRFGPDDLKRVCAVPLDSGFHIPILWGGRLGSRGRSVGVLAALEGRFAWRGRRVAPPRKRGRWRFKMSNEPLTIDVFSISSSVLLHLQRRLEARARAGPTCGEVRLRPFFLSPWVPAREFRARTISHQNSGSFDAYKDDRQSGPRRLRSKGSSMI